MTAAATVHLVSSRVKKDGTYSPKAESDHDSSDSVDTENASAHATAVLMESERYHEARRIRQERINKWLAEARWQNLQRHYPIVSPSSESRQKEAALRIHKSMGEDKLLFSPRFERVFLHTWRSKRRLRASTSRSTWLTRY